MLNKIRVLHNIPNTTLYTDISLSGIETAQGCRYTKNPVR